MKNLKNEAMKTLRLLILFALLFAANISLQAQNQITDKFVGKWSGNLIINSKVQPNIGFEISAIGNNEYLAVMHSFDQKTYNIFVDQVVLSRDSVALIIKSMGVKYSGLQVSDSSITGSFEQIKGKPWKLDLKKCKEFPYPVAKRPQDPIRPYKYYTEEVTFDNPEAGVKISGTFTRPQGEGKFKCVVLISGSGPSDRNQTIFGHKTFLVLADYLTKNGIAVLRYDDRGTGESTGKFSLATELDHAQDASYAINYLSSRSDTDKDNIGILGHSLGADIAPLTANMNPKTSFVILMSGAAISLKDNIIEQCNAIFPTMGISPEGIELNRRIMESTIEIFRTQPNDSIAKVEIKKNLASFDALVAKMNPFDRENLGLSVPLKIQSYSKLLQPFMRYDLFYNPYNEIQKIKCPVFALAGDKDIQVLPHNLDLIKKALTEGGNKNVTAKLYSGKNHLLQSCVTGTVEEYSDIEETISDEVLLDIANWINQLHF